MYFVSLDPAGCLLGLRMTPMEIRNFRLRHALAQDARWLRDTLDREGKPFGTAVELTGDNRLELTWTSASCLRGSGADPKV
jgi:poly-gamma-glutamate synthesis protein (capsule biosynthesis protein)